MGQICTWGVPRGGHNPQGAPGPPGEGILDYGVLEEPAYVTWVRLMGYKDTI